MNAECPLCEKPLDQYGKGPKRPALWDGLLLWAHTGCVQQKVRDRWRDEHGPEYSPAGALWDRETQA